MIDIESEVFTEVATALRNTFNPISVYGEYVKSPATFPAVMIEERANATLESSQDSTLSENHATLMYEVNVYSNKTVGKKSECKAVFARVDEVFQSLGFTRIMKEPVPNLDDATIYRMVGRYRAVVSTDKTIYRR